MNPRIRHAKALLILLVGLVGLVATYVVGTKKGEGRAKVVARQRAWQSVLRLETGRDLRKKEPTAPECSCELLLKIWGVIDSASTRLGLYNPSGDRAIATIGEHSRMLIQSALFDGPSRYHELLPILAGALDTMGLSFHDFLAIREQTAKQAARYLTGKQGKFWSYTVEQQRHACESLGVKLALRPEDREPHDANSCCEKLVAYLESGRRPGIDFEYWIAVDGVHYLVKVGGSSDGAARGF